MHFTRNNYFHSTNGIHWFLKLHFELFTIQMVQFLRNTIADDFICSFLYCTLIDKLKTHFSKLKSLHKMFSAFYRNRVASESLVCQSFRTLFIGIKLQNKTKKKRMNSLLSSSVQFVYKEIKAKKSIWRNCQFVPLICKSWLTIFQCDICVRNTFWSIDCVTHCIIIINGSIVTKFARVIILNSCEKYYIYKSRCSVLWNLPLDRCIALENSYSVCVFVFFF